MISAEQKSLPPGEYSTGKALTPSLCKWGITWKDEKSQTGITPHRWYCYTQLAPVHAQPPEYHLHPHTHNSRAKIPRRQT